MEKIYTFNKIDEKDIPLDQIYYVYGDNLSESIQIIKWIAEYNKEFMEFSDIKYISIARYAYIYKIFGKDIYFIAKAYHRDGKLPNVVMQLITNIDKPDAVIYSPFLNKVLFGFETTESTLAGNATWQRTGRTIDFLNKGIPFAFLAYASKLDQSNINASHKPRTPSGIFVLFYLMISLKYHTPALIGFFEHKDSTQSKGMLKIDYRLNLFKYVFSVIFNCDNKYDNLEKCFNDMGSYYRSNLVAYNEFSLDVRRKVINEDFGYLMVENIVYGNNFKLFTIDDVKYKKWMPKIISERLYKLFPNIDFYQLSNNCKAGISFQTEDIIEVIDSKNTIYAAKFINSIDEPIIIIPINLTKNQNGNMVYTDDPYNGEISAFAELYTQIFPRANIMILLKDHSKKEEYDISGAKHRKIYKSISNYANIVVDMDLQICDKNSTASQRENKSKYENIKVTEDDVTCFFETVLKQNNIRPSFINPPCGSWSDMELLPTNRYYYYKKKDERADIAYYKDGVYHIGESKDYYSSLKRTIDQEYKKIQKVRNVIESNIKLDLEYKIFTIFYGKTEEAIEALKSNYFDYCIVLQEDDKKIEMKVLDKDEIYR